MPIVKLEQKFVSRSSNLECSLGTIEIVYHVDEFIITTVKFNPEKQVRIVYAGAASGRGTGIVATLFPWIQFDCLTPINFLTRCHQCLMSQCFKLISLTIAH